MTVKLPDWVKQMTAWIEQRWRRLEFHRGTSAWVGAMIFSCFPDSRSSGRWRHLRLSGSPACRQQRLLFLQLHNHMIQNFIIHQLYDQSYLFSYLLLIWVLVLWSTLVQYPWSLMWKTIMAQHWYSSIYLFTKWVLNTCPVWGTIESITANNNNKIPAPEIILNLELKQKNR